MFIAYTAFNIHTMRYGDRWKATTMGNGPDEGPWWVFFFFPSYLLILMHICYIFRHTTQYRDRWKATIMGKGPNNAHLCPCWQRWVFFFFLSYFLNLIFYIAYIACNTRKIHFSSWYRIDEIQKKNWFRHTQTSWTGLVRSRTRSDPEGQGQLTLAPHIGGRSSNLAWPPGPLGSVRAGPAHGQSRYTNVLLVSQSNLTQ